ncbi:crosslink repair DNA glycosylase YcaQ family protein [Micromonospora sp. WMMD710]|uniref:DNA glycosylase AlkZ-like family protein n=1 Tax=Micromonospora sp. WMMD710 TaxID=3016085 RepID=UPI002415D6BB|nr:crosslink repair DNA glycosylase YcaQ family protein [Micromonospora sp. WMMD710]MDG4759034.1 crosslink repair DNA glycosylase YcaQ family protein [Micromonospora sp. WMMD710]
MVVHQIDRAQARRIAVRAQLLAAPRPPDLLTVVRQLTLVQIDPTAAVAPSADLVCWSRLGSSYQPEHLRRALERDRTLFEHHAMVRPMEDLGLHLAAMAQAPAHGRQREWLRANDSFRRDVLDLLRSNGPLLSRDIPDTCAVPWPSSGWTNNRNVTQMLEFLVLRGEVGIAGRRGRQRLWDVAERVYPAGTPVVPVEQAHRLRNERRLRALGIAREKTVVVPGEPAEVGDAGEPAVVEGVAGVWRVDPAALGQPFTGRTAVLSPFDRLVHDRVRLAELFDYEYVLEMYKPKANRRWGYFALPILHGDRLVGKVDATADRRRGAFTVHAVHEDVPFTPELTRAVHGELHDLASWLTLTVEGLR